MAEYTWQRITYDTCLSHHKLWIGAILITPTSGSSGTVTLYNGESAADPKVLKVQTGTTVTFSLSFAEPLYCDRGLYVDIGDNVDELLIQIYESEP